MKKDKQRSVKHYTEN